MDVPAGTAASLRIDFLDPLGLLVVDATSASYQLMATDGSLLAGPVPLITAPTDTGVTVAIGAGSNTITAPRLFEKRTVVVSMTSGGKSHTFVKQYRVIPFLNLGCTEDDVRAVIGVNADELANDEIDLTAAYFILLKDVTPAQMSAALSCGTAVELMANQAVVGQAVLEIFSGVPNKTPLSIKEGQMSFVRSAPKWGPVIQQARDQRARGIAAITGLAETVPTWLATTHSRDPVTSWHGHASWP